MATQVKRKFTLPEELNTNFLIPSEGANPRPHHLGMVYKLVTSKTLLDQIHGKVPAPTDKKAENGVEGDEATEKKDAELTHEEANISVKMLVV
jgi:hypothetical protein